MSASADSSGLRREARAILARNDRGGYTVPTGGLYPFQWNWDSAFCAMGFSTFDEARAWRELERLFEGQWDDGLVPHIVFHQAAETYFPGPEVWGTRHAPPTSGITQPPVAATSARYLLDRARDRALADARAARLYPKLLAWHDWGARARDPEGSGLVAILHPWESGMDNSPAWDAPMDAVPATTTPYQRRDTGHVDSAMRPRKADYDRYVFLLETFRAADWDPAAMWRAAPLKVADIGVNAILQRAERDLVHLAARFGTVAERARIATRIDRRDAAIATLWNGDTGLYHSRDLRTDRMIELATSAGFLPLWAGLGDRARVAALAAALARWCDLGRYGAPTVAPDDPRFDGRRYWRGPVWGIMNWMIGDGLAAHGEVALAARIRADTRDLIASGGFAEYFDPRDGSPCGGAAFSWTAAVLLAWAAPENEAERVEPDAQNMASG